MAQLNSLIVTGNSRFLNPINGDARNGVYYVKGTQTAATGSWTGVIPVPALYDGLTIMYYLPYNGSGNATLNLTLSNGTTTGAVNCYYGNATRLTTHYNQGSNIVMTYHPAGSISINGTATTDNRWIANANYADGNSTAYTITNYYNRFKAGANKVFPYTIIMQCSDGRWESIVTSSSTGTSKARNTHGFRLGQIALMYANATYNEDATIGDNTIYEEKSDLIDHRYSFNTANDATNGTTAVKPVYLVGTVNATDGLFYLDTKWWTQTLPSTADGKVYIYLGDAYDYYRMSFRIHHPIYHYSNGAVRQFAQDAATVNGKALPTSASSHATGISVADHTTGTITGVQSSTTTASKVTLGTAISVPNVTGATDVTVPKAASSATTVPIKNASATSIPNVTSVGSASNWVFEDITVPKAASSATSIPNVTAAGSGSFTQGAFDGGSGSFTATVTNGVLSFSHTHTAATHGADSHTHTAPTLGTAISVTGVSGSTTASHVKSGGNGTAPTLGTAISIIGVQSTTTSVTGVSGSTTASKVTLGTAISVPNVTGVSDVTVPIKNTSATTVVTSKTHTVTDNGHTHTLS